MRESRPVEIPQKRDEVRSMPRCEFLVLITLTTEYAPVTISDNEALGSDKEGEYDENEDIVNGMRLGCIHSGVIQYSQ